MSEVTPTSRDGSRTFGPLLLLGAPGVGKGTQAQLLMDRFAVPQISTGDLLRQNVRDRTPLGETAEALMRQGRFVPDDVVNRMVADRLLSPDTHSGYVLDGFPRTQGQADWLDQELASSPGALPLLAVQITVPEVVLLQRITGRRTCPTCRRIYNVWSSPAKVEGVCDLDGTALVHRSDDTDSAFAERMLEFDRETGQVIRHYRAAGRFREIDGEQSIYEVHDRILEAIRELRRKPAGRDDLGHSA